jgi:hypothetical protein
VSLTLNNTYGACDQVSESRLDWPHSGQAPYNLLKANCDPLGLIEMDTSFTEIQFYANFIQLLLDASTDELVKYGSTELGQSPHEIQDRIGGVAAILRKVRDRGRNRP